jgi:hypothetical protein
MFTSLLFYVHGLAVVQAVCAANHDGIAGRNTGHNFNINAVRCTYAHRPALYLAIMNQEHRRLAIFTMDGTLRNQRPRFGFAFRRRLIT